MRESAWVIEGIGPIYWNGKGLYPSCFTGDHLQAIRFSRKVDAEVVLYYLLEIHAIFLAAREHVWMGE